MNAWQVIGVVGLLSAACIIVGFLVVMMSGWSRNERLEFAAFVFGTLAFSGFVVLSLALVVGDLSP